MKRFALGALVFALAASLFAADDNLQTLAIVKLNKPEAITLKQLKNKVELYQKQNNVASFTVDQKKEILNAIIDEKLVVQAAQKANLSITDSQVNQYFLQNMSQYIGRQVTEAQLAEIVKEKTKLSLDEFMKQQTGMNVADYKASLKTQLLAQQYVLKEKQSELQTVAPTDKEIRAYYDLNKASFVQNDMLKVFVVVVPKGKNEEAARVKANKMLQDLKDKKTTFDDLKAKATPDSDFQVANLFIGKSSLHAQQLGISPNELLGLFDKDVGYISSLNPADEYFQFYAIREKFGFKVLSLSDVVQPDTTITVYDYIKQGLTQQHQSQFLMRAVQDITQALNTPQNVDWKKKGAALDELLNW